MRRLVLLALLTLLIAACGSIQELEDGPGRITADNVGLPLCSATLPSGSFGTTWGGDCASSATPTPVAGALYFDDLANTSVITDADDGRYLRISGRDVVYDDGPEPHAATVLPMRIGWADTATFTAAAFPTQTGTTQGAVVPQYTGSAPRPYVAVWIEGATDGEVTGLFEGDNALVGDVFADYSSTGLSVGPAAGRLYVSSSGVDPALHAGQTWRATIARVPPSGLTQEQVLALMYPWAQDGNTDPLPAWKLVNAPSTGGGTGGLNEAAVDARIDAKVYTPTSATDTNTIPLSRLDAGETRTVAPMRSAWQAAGVSAFTPASFASGDGVATGFTNTGITVAEYPFTDSPYTRPPRPAGSPSPQPSPLKGEGA